MTRRMVLLVDDEPLIRMNLADALQQAGFATLEARSAAHAISMLHECDMHGVITDIQMSGDLDGVGLALYVRERWPRTIIIVCSGKSRPAAGALDDATIFLAKPFGEDEMASVVRALSA
jgi:two-component system, response regulator PdtaR